MRRGSAVERLVLDASVLVEVLAGSRAVRELVKGIVEGRIEAYAAQLSLAEAYYVSCRLWGPEKARERMELLLDSGTIWVVGEEEIWSLAAECKCLIPVSLGDCHTLAAAKKYRVTPLFLHPEREIVENLDRIREWLSVKPRFLLDSL